MSTKILGNTLDIHGGGLDLQFPHHENELAQSESFTGVTFSRYWMHNGLLKWGKGGKMAGSVGNVINVADALRHVSGEVLRFFLISTHYRSPIDLGDPDAMKLSPVPQGLENAQKGYETFTRFAERYTRITNRSFHDLAALSHAPGKAPSFRRPEFGELYQRFREYMDDDFNTGGAVAVLFELVTALNKFADAAKLEDAAAANADARTAFEEGATLLKLLGQVLGLFFEAPKAASGSDRLLGGLMQLLIDLRADARKAKNFAVSDQIRKRLGELGITLEDRPGGTGWRIG